MRRSGVRRSLMWERESRATFSVPGGIAPSLGGVGARGRQERSPGSCISGATATPLPGLAVGESKEPGLRSPPEGMFSCDQTRSGLACGCDGDDGLVRGRHDAHVPEVRRAGLLRAGQQETVAVLHPTQLREPCDVGAGRRTRARDDVQRVAAAGIRARVGCAVARSARRGTRVLLPHVRTVPGLVRWRR
jgi:hypothetical protein